MKTSSAPLKFISVLVTLAFFSLIVIFGCHPANKSQKSVSGTSTNKVTQTDTTKVDIIPHIEKSVMPPPPPVRN